MNLGHWNAWSIVWLVWLLEFLGIEIYALVTNVQNTLSFQVWRAEGTGASIVRFLVGAFLVWLFGHMVFLWWRG